MAKRRKGRKPYIRKTLLKQKTTRKGNTIYTIPPSKVREAEFKKMVKKANDRLYKLEKAGLTRESHEYREVEHYAISNPKGKGWIYNVDVEKGRIRFKGSLKDLSTSEKQYLINTLRNFLNAQTSTVRGTKKAFKQAYRSFISNPQNAIKGEITEEQYKNMWKVYHDQVKQDKLTNQGYNVFMELIRTTNFYELDKDQMEQAFYYMAESEKVTTTGIASDVIDNLKEFDKIKLTQI